MDSVYRSIGDIYSRESNFTESLKNKLAALRICEEIGDKEEMATCLTKIGYDYIKLKKNNEASRCLIKGLSLAKEIGSLMDIKESYDGLASLDSAKGDFKQAMVNYKMYVFYKDSLVNKENANKTTQIQMQYEFDKKQHADSIQRAAENRISLMNLQKQKVYTGLGIAGFILVVLLLFFVYRSYTLQRKATAEMAISSQREEQHLKTEFKKQLAQAETKALRAQMNPHFIFNCLNSINSFIIDGKHEIASDYLINFSKLIRLILDNSRSETISLEKELEALKLYILLEAARFDNKFKCVYRIAENLDPSMIMIPPMLLQPFIENAIWHGLMHKETEGTITLEIKNENEEFLNISIIDDGIGREKAAELKSKSVTHKSHGLKVTSQRIEMMNKLNSTGAHVNIIDLKDQQGHASGTRVELIIPF
jgi:tetratricopeptide (TPR) repeat protein